MLHQYTQNDVNREPVLLKKWLVVNKNVKEKESSNKERCNKLDKSKN